MGVHTKNAVTGNRRNWSIAVVAGLVILGAFLIRIRDVERRGFCHPENYVPGLAVPSWVRDPPVRTDLPTLAKSLLRDAHPPLYYLLMLPWVDRFGMGLDSIRLPSVLLGAASVFLLWRIALRETRRETALVAAALLAMHGQQIYWSQTARVYALAIFLCLLSTFLLWKALDGGRRRWRIAYALATIAALWTHVYCWPVVLGQVLWSALRAVRTKSAPSVLATQVASAIVSMPVLALAVFLYRPMVSTDPPLEYFEFGYLFWSGAIFRGQPPQAIEAGWGVTVGSVGFHHVALALGILAVALGLLARPVPAIPGTAPGAGSPPSQRLRRTLLLLGALVAAGLAAAAIRAFHPGTKPFATVLGVAAASLILGAAFPAIHAMILRAQARDRGPIPWIAARVVRLSPVLALFPYLCMVASSRLEPAFLARGTMLFVPYLLLVAATGLTPAGRLKWVTSLPLVATLGLHFLSVGYARGSEHTLRDYRALGAAIESTLGKDDLILITNEYSDPPLLYYLPNRHHQFVPADWSNVVATKKARRVWVIRYEDQELTPGLRAAVAGLRPSDTVTVPGARALLFLR